MKAFHFTLEAVRVLRQRQENDALEKYARALAVRQQALDALEAARESLQAHWAEMRRQLARHCSAVQASQLHQRQSVLEQRQQECVAALRAAERGVNGASQGMLLARQRREIVDTFRDKQLARHQRLAARAEQTALDELAIRRNLSFHSHFS